MKIYPFENTSRQFVRDRVIELCQQLIQIDSVNPPGNEFDVARCIVNRLQQIDVEVELVDHGDNRASVIGSLHAKPYKGNPGLVLSGHLDTVPLGNQRWTSNPFGGELVGGKIWGRGSADMKGGVAAMIVATEILVREKLPLAGNLFLAFSADEEANSLGAQVLAHRLAAHELMAILIGEPSENALYIAEKGALWLELTTHGQSAHGSAPDEGVNAITGMMALLDALDSVLRNPLLYQEVNDGRHYFHVAQFRRARDPLQGPGKRAGQGSGERGLPGAPPGNQTFAAGTAITFGTG